MSANQKVFWITGASSGIGEALVYEASAKGASVILSARRKEELERVSSGCTGETKVVPLDLTDQKGLKKAAEEVLLLQIRRFFPSLFFKIARKVSPT